MKLFTKALYEQLLKNGSNSDKDHPPVVKLFTPDAQCTWLISEINPKDSEMAFGLCDLGFGEPELGYIYLPEIQNLRGKLGLPVERDYSFDGKYPMSVYADAARKSCMVTESETALRQSAEVLNKGK